MLLGGKQKDLKQVAVVTRNQQFNRLLGSLLGEWRFFAVEDVAEASVVFVERGLDPPESAEVVVWLTPMPLSEGVFLSVPFSLTRLYHLLEVHFFPTPRRHIRVAIETSVDLNIESNWLEGRLISLSDRGGRIVSKTEIPRGKLLNLEVKLGGRTVQMPAEVLYCIPAGDSPGRSQAQIGVLFKPKSDKETVALRHYIEKVSIESACIREDIPLNDPCLSWLDLPKDPWS